MSSQTPSRDSIAPARKTSTCQSLSHDHQSEASTNRERKNELKETGGATTFIATTNSKMALCFSRP
jgi:hypothetical protein